MTSGTCEQFSDELLESYALGRLAEPGCAPLEEHLLLCPACQERLSRTDEFVAAMKAAAVPRARKGPARAVTAQARPRF